jgi:hypothetical protein
MSNRIYYQIIAPAADDVTKLRGIDLDRVLINANNNFRNVRDAFAHWPRGKRARTAEGRKRTSRSGRLDS